MYEELQEGMYENSFCMKEDYLLEEANSDNVDAMYMLAVLYFEDCQMNSAYKWFCKAAEKGQADAIYYIGNFYWHPDGWDLVEPSNEKAIEYYTKAAELGSAKAMSELGKQYLQGTVAVEKDEVKAFELFQKAAKLGESEGYYWLAMCYKYGSGVEKDFEKAFNYAIKAYNAIH
ncbi:MAG: sel1 repeat family protein [Ruminiclostridium sp.]|nr:sel1 repeat family protein [Ruminiclostridium sp.]